MNKIDQMPGWYVCERCPDSGSCLQAVVCKQIRSARTMHLWSDDVCTIILKGVLKAYGISGADVQLCISFPATKIHSTRVSD
jgi:hypothetical protein